jgi:hypothetical protein
MKSQKKTEADRRVLNAVAEVRELLLAWEGARPRIPLPPEAIEAVEDLIISLASPDFLWTAGRAILLGHATRLCRRCEGSLDDHGYLVNITLPQAFLDAVERVLEAAYCIDNPPPTEPGVSVLPCLSMREHSVGNSNPRFIARSYGWLRDDGEHDEVRGREALRDFRGGKAVRHPTTLTIKPREVGALRQHPGHVQAFADRLQQLRQQEQTGGVSDKVYGDEVEEVANGDITPVEITPYAPTPLNRPTT